MSCSLVPIGALPSTRARSACVTLRDEVSSHMRFWIDGGDDSCWLPGVAVMSRRVRGHVPERRS